MDSNNQKGMLSEELDTTKMPGHWLLARLGKRVLRPGGRELTRQMLDSINIYVTLRMRFREPLCSFRQGKLINLYFSLFNY